MSSDFLQLYAKATEDLAAGAKPEVVKARIAKDVGGDPEQALAFAEAVLKGKPPATGTPAFRVLAKSGADFVIYGPASVAIVDQESDLITGPALKAALPQLIQRARISLQHLDILPGEILEKFGDLKTEVRAVTEQDLREFSKLQDAKVEVGTDALFLVGKIYDDTPYALEVREQILKGELNAFSLSGQAVSESPKVVCGPFACKFVNEISKIALSAVTLCKTGMNQGAGFVVLHKSMFKAHREQCGCSEKRNLIKRLDTVIDKLSDREYFSQKLEWLILKGVPGEWVAYQGKRGGVGARNTRTGKVVYGAKAQALLQGASAPAEEEAPVADQAVPEEEGAGEPALEEASPEDEFAEQDSQPGEEDVTSEDPNGPFYYLGEEIASNRQELAEWMQHGGYFPTVWTISDHGNAEPLDFNADEELVGEPLLDEEGNLGTPPAEPEYGTDEWYDTHINDATTIIDVNSGDASFVDQVLGEAEAYGVDVSDLRAELEGGQVDEEFVYELAEDAMGRLEDAGFPNDINEHSGAWIVYSNDGAPMEGFGPAPESTGVAPEETTKPEYGTGPEGPLSQEDSEANDEFNEEAQMGPKPGTPEFDEDFNNRVNEAQSKIGPGQPGYDRSPEEDAKFGEGLELGVGTQPDPEAAQLVSDAAEGDPGEANEPPVVGQDMSPEELEQTASWLAQNKSLENLRGMQELLEAQIESAYKQRNTAALARLQQRYDNVSQAIDRQQFGDWAKSADPVVSKLATLLKEEVEHFGREGIGLKDTKTGAFKPGLPPSKPATTKPIEQKGRGAITTSERDYAPGVVHGPNPLQQPGTRTDEGASETNWNKTGRGAMESVGVGRQGGARHYPIQRSADPVTAFRNALKAVPPKDSEETELPVGYPQKPGHAQPVHGKPHKDNNSKPHKHPIEHYVYPAGSDRAKDSANEERGGNLKGFGSEQEIKKHLEALVDKVGPQRPKAQHHELYGSTDVTPAEDIKSIDYAIPKPGGGLQGDPKATAFRQRYVTRSNRKVTKEHYKAPSRGYEPPKDAKYAKPSRKVDIEAGIKPAEQLAKLIKAVLPKPKVGGAGLPKRGGDPEGGRKEKPDAPEPRVGAPGEKKGDEGAPEKEDSKLSGAAGKIGDAAQQALTSGETQTPGGAGTQAAAGKAIGEVRHAVGFGKMQKGPEMAVLGEAAGKAGGSIGGAVSQLANQAAMSSAENKAKDEKPAIDGVVLKPGAGHEHSAKFERALDHIKEGAGPFPDKDGCQNADEHAHKIAYSKVGKSGFHAEFTMKCPACVELPKQIHDPATFFDVAFEYLNKGVLRDGIVHPKDQERLLMLIKSSEQVK